MRAVLHTSLRARWLYVSLQCLLLSVFTIFLRIFRLKMTRVRDPKVEKAILMLHSIGKSMRKISKLLEKKILKRSPSTILSIIRKNSDQAKTPTKPVKRLTNPGSPKIRTKDLVQKVKRDIDKRNPLSQRKIAKKHNISQKTVNRLIHEDLHAVVRKKYPVHALSDKQIAQRYEIGRRFLEFLGGERYKKIITVDECWIYLSNTGGERRIYYEFKGTKNPESWTKYWKKQHPIGVMVFMGVTFYGKSKLRFVKPDAKINQDYYIENLLTPLFRDDIPELFAGQKYRPLFHQDNAPAHAGKKTQAWLENSEFDYIPKELWMGNSPDMALMDFCVNGYFKQQLFDRHPTTLAGLKRVAVEVWEGLDQGVIQRGFQSWVGRVQMMVDNYGHHVEHKLNGKKCLENKEN